jgi:hypothetical protein
MGFGFELGRPAKQVVVIVLLHCGSQLCEGFQMPHVDRAIRNASENLQGTKPRVARAGGAASRPSFKIQGKGWEKVRAHARPRICSGQGMIEQQSHQTQIRTRRSAWATFVQI